MIRRDGDSVALELSMQEYQSLLIALGAAFGVAMIAPNPILMDSFKRLMASVTEIKHGAE